MSTLPPGYSPATHTVTPDDHGAFSVIATSIGLVFILLFQAIRLWMKHPFTARLTADDMVLLVATTIAFLQAVIILAVVDQGFGKSERILSANQIQHVQKTLYASEYFYVISLFLSKISMLCLELRLSPESTQVLLTKGSLGIATLGLVASIVMVAVGCNAAQPWFAITNECSSMFTRWIVVAAFGILTEVLIFVLITRIFSTVQRLLSGKIKGVAVFALRLPVIVFTVIRLMRLHTYLNSDDPTFTGVSVNVWTQAELAYSLSTATIPMLMPFMHKLNTGMGAFMPETVISQSLADSRGYPRERTHGSHSRGGRDPLSSHWEEGMEHIRLDKVEHTAAITVPRQVDQRSVSSDDSTGLIIKKRVETTVSVHPL